MFCENCGNKMQEGHKFCTKCGHSNVPATAAAPAANRGSTPSLDDRWWNRLLKVVYIFFYLQILWIVPVVWSVNSTSWSYYGGYEDTTASAFWYSVLTIVIFVVIMRLIKVSALYVLIGQKPDWRGEFKKIF